MPSTRSPIGRCTIVALTMTIAQYTGWQRSNISSTICHIGSNFIETTINSISKDFL